MELREFYVRYAVSFLSRLAGSLENRFGLVEVFSGPRWTAANRPALGSSDRYVLGIEQVLYSLASGVNWRRHDVEEIGAVAIAMGSLPASARRKR